MAVWFKCTRCGAFELRTPEGGGLGSVSGTCPACGADSRYYPATPPADAKRLQPGQPQQTQGKKAPDPPTVLIPDLADAEHAESRFRATPDTRLKAGLSSEHGATASFAQGFFDEMHDGTSSGNVPAVPESAVPVDVADPTQGGAFGRTAPVDDDVRRAVRSRLDGPPAPVADEPEDEDDIPATQILPALRVGVAAPSEPAPPEPDDDTHRLPGHSTSGSRPVMRAATAGTPGTMALTGLTGDRIRDMRTAARGTSVGIPVVNAAPISAAVTPAAAPPAAAAKPAAVKPAPSNVDQDKPQAATMALSQVPHRAPLPAPPVAARRTLDEPVGPSRTAPLAPTPSSVPRSAESESESGGTARLGAVGLASASSIKSGPTEVADGGTAKLGAVRSLTTSSASSSSSAQAPAASIPGPPPTGPTLRANATQPTDVDPLASTMPHIEPPQGGWDLPTQPVDGPPPQAAAWGQQQPGQQQPGQQQPQRGATLQPGRLEPVLTPGPVVAVGSTPHQEMRPAELPPDSPRTDVRQALGTQQAIRSTAPSSKWPIWKIAAVVWGVIAVIAIIVVVI